MKPTKPFRPAPKPVRPSGPKRAEDRPRNIPEKKTEGESLEGDIGLKARIGAINLIEAALAKRGGLDEAGASAEFMALSDSERGFARALALLVLRRLGQLDHIIARKTQKMPPEPVRQLLRIGMAQIFFMNVPDFAAVSTTVKLSERANNTRPFKGLINAILRGLIREGGLKDVSPARLVPDWIIQRWKQTYGEETALGVASMLTEEPATDLSFARAADMDALAPALEGTKAASLTLRSALRGDVRGWAGYEDGLWWVQDVSAAAAVDLLGDLTGKSALDVCAAPGGKTLQLLGKGAEVVALDRSKNRLKRVEENLTRLKQTAEIHCADAQGFEDERRFDVVLLDAPCSSTGTFRRQPDVLWATKPADIAKLADVQHRMLDACAERVKPGGSLIYCVCSLEREEGETQIIAFLARNKGFVTERVTDDQLSLLGAGPEAATAQGWLRLLPHQRPGGQDGFFVAHLRRL
jgi:16S rRNA (cytosine967-C5)-methyltransferase